jgi:hypothetical protein
MRSRSSAVSTWTCCAVLAQQMVGILLQLCRGGLVVAPVATSDQRVDPLLPGCPLHLSGVRQPASNSSRAEAVAMSAALA